MHCKNPITISHITVFQYSKLPIFEICYWKLNFSTHCTCINAAACMYAYLVLYCMHKEIEYLYIPLISVNFLVEKTFKFNCVYVCGYACDDLFEA